MKNRRVPTVAIPRARSLARLRGGLRAIDALTLGAIAAVVLVVSLPRLRDFALRENEADALRLTGRLADLVSSSEPALRTADVRELLDQAPALAKQLDDAEFLAGGRRLRRHGYLFAAVAAEAGAPWIAAWPWKHGHTGRAAYAWTAELGLVGHPNADGAFSGLAAPPPRPDAGWRRIARER